MSILIERAGAEQKAAFFHKNRWKIARLLGGSASDEVSESKPKPKRRRKTRSKAKTTAKKTTAKKTTAKKTTPKAKAKTKASAKKSSSKAKPKPSAKQKEALVEPKKSTNTASVSTVSSEPSTLDSTNVSTDN